MILRYIINWHLIDYYLAEIRLGYIGEGLLSSLIGIACYLFGYYYFYKIYQKLGEANVFSGECIKPEVNHIGGLLGSLFL